MADKTQMENLLSKNTRKPIIEARQPIQDLPPQTSCLARIEKEPESLSSRHTDTHVWIYSQNDHLIQVGQIAPIPKWRSQKTNYPISNPLMNWIKETTLYPIPSPFTLALPKAHQSIDPQIPSPSTTDQPITPLAQI